MKNAFLIVAALLVGLVVGSWSVKSDLRVARQEIADLKKDLAARGRRETGLRGITSMLRIPEPTAPSLPEMPPENVAPRADKPARVPSTGSTSQVQATRQNFDDQMKSAVELWKTRSALARNSFLSNVAATPVQTQLFDQTVERMNQQLGERIRQWTDHVKQQKQVTPETGVRMMHNLGDTIIAGYDDLDRALPADWRDKAGPEFQLFDFINPEVALPLAEVEGAFNAARPRRNRRGGSPSDAQQGGIE